MSPLAQKYAGHRHGVFNDRIGDARSLLLGEVATPLGRMEMYLKGGGRTPYALRGDGYLGLRSAVKEYLVSHALYGIGIPTSLPLSICNHKRKIFRDQLEKSATVNSPFSISCSSWPFRMAGYQGERCSHEGFDCSPLVVVMAKVGEMSVEQFFKHSVQRTAHLAAAWQVLGVCCWNTEYR